MKYKLILLILLSMSMNFLYSQNKITWKKHTVTELGNCLTAVALDINGDKKKDVIASHDNKISLFLAPDWKKEIVLFHDSKSKLRNIHSAVFDADGDGDLDWVGSVAQKHPYWLENPGQSKALKGNWKRRSIDNTITGIHCILVTDVDKDGADDLLINNFLPNKGLNDSLVWFSRPKDINNSWNRHIFAKGDARGGSHYFGVADIDGDGWNEIAIGAKGQPFTGGNWFA